jgi:hypothetical protein
MGQKKIISSYLYDKEVGARGGGVDMGDSCRVKVSTRKWKIPSVISWPPLPRIGKQLSTWHISSFLKSLHVWSQMFDQPLFLLLLLLRLEMHVLERDLLCVMLLHSRIINENWEKSQSHVLNCSKVQMIYLLSW